MKLFSIYVLLFFIYSFFGWCLEVGCKLVSDKKFINRGFLIGPYCPIYGCGAIIMTILLQKYVNDPVTLFIMIVLICSILEYVTSYILEKIFQTRWWDYTKYQFNINGRICLETMIPFGIFGLFLMYISNPFLIHFINLLPLSILYIISFLIIFILLVDTFVSFRITSSLKIISSEIRSDSTEKITKMVRKEIMKRNQILQKRIIKAFPKLQILYSKGTKRKKKKSHSKS